MAEDYSDEFAEMWKSIGGDDMADKVTFEAAAKAVVDLFVAFRDQGLKITEAAVLTAEIIRRQNG